MLLIGDKRVRQILVKRVVEVGVVLPRPRGGRTIWERVGTGRGRYVCRAKVVEVIDLCSLGIMMAHGESGL
jgi:hypothetical protein